MITMWVNFLKWNQSVCTHSPAESRFCFSSFLMRGRPGFIFSGEVGVFCAAGWMKWANNSVCFNRYSNLLVRSVCYIHRKTDLLTYFSKNRVLSHVVIAIVKVSLPLSPRSPEQVLSWMTRRRHLVHRAQHLKMTLFQHLKNLTSPEQKNSKQKQSCLVAISYVSNNIRQEQTRQIASSVLVALWTKQRK